MHGGKLLGIMAAHRCFSLLGYFKGAEQNTKQSTSKDKEASATTGCKDSEPKAKKERAFNEAWRKEFDWLMYDNKSGKIAYIFQMVKTSSLRFVAGVKIFSWMA